MARPTATPEEIAKALILREAGYTVLAISQRLGLSVRTLQRHFAATSTKKGSAKSAVLDKARAELLDRIVSDEVIKEEAARLVADDLAHSRHLRDILVAASVKLEARDLRDAVLVMRAAAAYSTAIKNTSDTLRRGLRVERLISEPTSGLPELLVKELSNDEIAVLRVGKNVESST